MIIYNRTLNNCRFYEEQKDNLNLVSEIGCLRGLAYALGATGVNVLDLPGLEYYIGINNEQFIRQIKKESLPMKKKIYVVASNTAVTVICKASSKKDAVRIATDRWHEQGYDFEQEFTAYPADEYFTEDDGSDALIFPE